ncbi:MAG: YtxH domain-containing protein [Thioalkalivibrio sp.]|nr:YtxH domain-containing protein [Thioalkalivibrio sp.]
MRDHNDVPYIVIERDGGGQIGPFVVGALLGAGLALLFAPKSGEETQAELREQAIKLRDAAEDRMRDAQRNLEDRLHHAREGVQGRFNEVREAVEAGRSAATEARDDLERKLERSKAAYRAGVQAAREAAEPEPGEEDGANG